VSIYDLVVVVTEQLDGVGSCPSAVGFLVCDTSVWSCFEYLLFCQEPVEFATSRLECRKLNLMSPPQSEGNTDSVLVR